MSARGTLVAAVAVVVGVALVAVPVFGAVGGTALGSDGATAVQTNGTNDTATSNVSFGTRISSFMQANTAKTDSSVDAGMWAAEYNQSDDEKRPAVVQSRIDRLDRRSERLRERMAQLQSDYENGTIPRVAYQAQASRLTAELDALGDSIDETDERARAVGANTSQLDRLRTETRNLSGQEVAAVARDLGVGRPDHAGPPANGGPGEAGPPADRGPGDGGPPEDLGPSTNVTSDDQPGPPGERGRDGGQPAAGGNDSRTGSDSVVDERADDGQRGGPGADRGDGGDAADGTADTDDASEGADDATDGGAGTGEGADDAPGGGNSNGGSGGDSGSGSDDGPPGRT